MDDVFSSRHGFTQPPETIIIRNEAPDWLRTFVIARAYEASISPHELRDILCDILYKSPDPSCWGGSFIENEIRDLLQNKAEWYKVYDLIERLYYIICDRHDAPAAKRFSDKINQALFEKGIGWQLVDGKIIIRGDVPFEVTTKIAIDLASESGKTTTSGEMKEAILDLSRRPVPDLTGAVHHSMAALECLSRDITSEPKLTLGDWIKRHKQEFPAPLDIVVDKLWGYASEKGRHVKEGQLPSGEEAELVVTLSSALSTYLLRKHPF